MPSVNEEDRTGFAGAILLRLFKEKRFAAVVKGFLEVCPAYLATAFETIDYKYGSFENYVCMGLGHLQKDIEHLMTLYLE